MGNIQMPSEVKKVFHDKLSKKWISEKEWEKLVLSLYGQAALITLDNNVRVPFHQFFKSLEKKPFLIFFNTSFGPDPSGWSSLMSAQGYSIGDKNLGEYFIINNIERHGQPVGHIRDIEDVLFELQGDDMLLLVEHNNIPTSFIGDITDYPDLLDSISYNFLER